MIWYTFILYMILYHIWWVHKPAPWSAFWPGFIQLQHDHYCTAHHPLQAAFYYSISAFPLLATSEYSAILSSTWGMALSRSYACFCAALSWNSDGKALLMKSKVSRVAATNCSLGVSFLCVVGSCSESLLCELWNVVVIDDSSSQICITCKQNCRIQPGAKLWFKCQRK